MDLVASFCLFVCLPSVCLSFTIPRHLCGSNPGQMQILSQRRSFDIYFTNSNLAIGIMYFYLILDPNLSHVIDTLTQRNALSPEVPQPLISCEEPRAARRKDSDHVEILHHQNSGEGRRFSSHFISLSFLCHRYLNSSIFTQFSVPASLGRKMLIMLSLCRDSHDLIIIDCEAGR